MAQPPPGAAGAIGGSTGAVVSEAYLGTLEQEMQSLGDIRDGELSAQQQAMFERWRQDGIDLSRLAAATAAAIAGADGQDVNLAADAGQNAAGNNVLPLIIIVQGAMYAWTAYELYNAARNAADLIETLGNDDLTDEEFYRILGDRAPGIVIDAAVDVTVGKLKVVEKLYELTRKTSIGKAAEERLEQIIQKQRTKVAANNGLVIPPTREIPTWHGSGPQSGVIGLNGESLSNGTLRNFNPNEAVEFVFDPSTSTFLVRAPSSPVKHSILADSIGAPRDQVVGGLLTRVPDGRFLTNEASGHFHQNWTPELRSLFTETMRRYGLEFDHRSGM